MTEKKWIALVLFVIATAPLHVLAMRWLFERHAFCRDGVVALVPGYRENTECEYPEQTLSLEDGKTQKLGICRCKR